MPSVAAGLKRVLRPVLRPMERRLRPFAVLSYHRIAEPQRDPWQLAVAPSRRIRSWTRQTISC